MKSGSWADQEIQVSGVVFSFKALALVGSFYCFTHTIKFTNQPPMRGTIEHSNC